MQQPTSATYAQRRSVQDPAHDISGDTLRTRAQHAGFALAMFVGAAVGALVIWWLWPQTYDDNGASALRALIGCAALWWGVRSVRAWVGIRCALVALGCALIVWAGAAQAQAWNGGRVIGVALGGLVALTCFRFGYNALALTIREWQHWQEHREELRAAYLDAYREQGGQVVEEVVHVGDLSSGRLGDVVLLWVYIWMTRRHSIEELRGPVLLPGTRSSRRLGRVSKLTAERLGKFLGDVGLLVGRVPGKAGTIPDDLSLEESIALLVDRWQGDEPEVRS